MNSPTSFLTVYVLFAIVATVVTLLGGVRSAIRRAELSPREQRRSFWTVTTLFFAALLPSWLGFYQGAPKRIPSIEFGLLLPIIAGVIFYLRSSVLRRIAAAVPQTLVVGIQFYRLLGIIFLVLLAGGALPGVFTLPAGAGDVAVGLAAPAVAFAFARSLRGSAGLARAWNLFGLADLVVAVTTGFLSSPSPIQKLAFENPNRLITAFPWSWFRFSWCRLPYCFIWPPWPNWA